MKREEIDGDIIKLVDRNGPYDMVVSERVKCGLRDKLLFLEAMKGSQNIKQLLRIVHLKIPISFDNKKYDELSKVPVSHGDSEVERKALKEVKEAFHANIEKYEAKLVEEYKLKEPTTVAILGLLDVLLSYHSRVSPKEMDFNRMKISPQMAEILEDIMRYHEIGMSEEKMTTNCDFTLDRENLFGADSMKTASDIISAIMHQLPLRVEKWQTPTLSKKFDKYPCVCKLTLPAINAAIADEKAKVLRKTSKTTATETIREYVCAMLNVEKLLLPHLERVEKYYANCAENIGKITLALKKMTD